MSHRARSRLVAAALVVVGGASLATGCSDTGGKDAFCDRVADTPQITETLARLDVSDPGGSRRRLEEAVASFRSLEADAPGEIRSDLARLRQGVEVVLEAVRDNPDDLPAAREAILEREDELAGLAQAGRQVADYARTECRVDLTESFDGSGPTTEPSSASSTSSTSSTTSTDGSAPTSTEGPTTSDNPDSTDGDPVEPGVTDPTTSEPDVTDLSPSRPDDSPDGDGG